MKKARAKFDSIPGAVKQGLLDPKNLFQMADDPHYRANFLAMNPAQIAEMFSIDYATASKVYHTAYEKEQTINAEIERIQNLDEEGLIAEFGKLFTKESK